MKFSCKLLGHKWNGCRCERCGQLRDENHAWQGAICSVCHKTRDIHTITDQSLLRDIILNKDAYDYDYRRMAVYSEHLKDISILNYITLHTNDRSDIPRLIENKIEHLINSEKNQSILAELVMNMDDGYNAELIIKSKALTDSSLLQTIAEHAQSKGVRNRAGEKLASHIQSIVDQETLLTLAKTSSIPQVRRAAAVQLNNQSVLADIIRKDSDENVRRAVLEAVSDPELIIQAARRDKSEYVRAAAAQRIDDQSILLNIALKDKNNIVRNQAMLRLTDPIAMKHLLMHGKDVLVVIFYRYMGALNNCDPSGYETNFPRFKSAVTGITDYDLLTAALRNVSDWGRLTAERRAVVAETIAARIDNPQIIELVHSARKALREERALDDHLRSIEAGMHTAEACPHVEKDVPFVAGQKTEQTLKPKTSFGNDLDYIVQSLRTSERVKIDGYAKGTLLKIPQNATQAKLVQRNAIGLYQMFGLESIDGPQLMGLMSDPDKLFTGPFLDQIVVYKGFPSRCLKCGASVARFELLVGLNRNEKNLRKFEFIGAHDADDLYTNIQYDKHFIAIPCCEIHSLAESFYFAPGSGLYPFFTDDRDIAATCMANNRRGGMNLPFMTLVSFKDGKLVVPYD